MDIPNLSQNQPTPVSNSNQNIPNNSKLIFFIIAVLAIVSGFWISRFLPLNKSGTSIADSIIQKDIISADKIKDQNSLEVGKYYGNTGKTFTDSATGTIVTGGINGEGTHTLQREGGKTQNAALTSSTVDLDMFVGKKVEIKGETNSSTKAGWFLDVGVIKITE